MAAIAGVIGLREAARPQDSCQCMLRALEPYSSSDGQVQTVGSVSFGRNRDNLLPEDRFDRQPAVGRDGRTLFVADARIDNRDELAFLDQGRPPDGRSDADILFAAWERWGAGLTDHVIGDYAMAAWSGGDDIILLRSPLAQKGLFFTIQPHCIAFASEPAALHAGGLVPKSIRRDIAARIAAQSLWSLESIFAGIEPVPHSRALCLNATGAREVASWSPENSGQTIRTLSDAADALRHELDRAVESQLRRSSGAIAVALSSGRDSSAVAASAALAAADTEIICLTAAPKAGFPARPTARHEPDEADLAAKTAALYSNVRHVICRPDRIEVTAALERAHRLHHLPLLNPIQLPWWDRLENEAAGLGARVMLSGGGGNFSISLGGPEFFADVMRHSPATGLSAAWKAVRVRPRHGATLIKHVLAPHLPRRLFKLLSQSRARLRPPTRFPFLRDEYRQPLENEADMFMDELRPIASYRDYRRGLLMNRDYPGKMNIAIRGFDDRDPTLDRRLVELVYSFDPEWQFPTGSERPVFDRAFGSRLPKDVLRSRKRGLQSVDWQEHFTGHAMSAGFAKYGSSPLVAEIFDLRRVASLIETGSTADQRALVSALSVASFLWVHEPG